MKPLACRVRADVGGHPRCLPGARCQPGGFRSGTKSAKLESRPSPSDCRSRMVHPMRTLACEQKRTRPLKRASVFLRAESPATGARRGRVCQTCDASSCGMATEGAPAGGRGYLPMSSTVVTGIRLGSTLALEKRIALRLAFGDVLGTPHLERPASFGGCRGTEVSRAVPIHRRDACAPHLIGCNTHASST
jgi:hypothetical protein